MTGRRCLLPPCQKFNLSSRTSVTYVLTSARVESQSQFHQRILQSSSAPRAGTGRQSWFCDDPRTREQCVSVHRELNPESASNIQTSFFCWSIIKLFSLDFISTSVNFLQLSNSSFYNTYIILFVFYFIFFYLLYFLLFFFYISIVFSIFSNYCL